MPKEGFKSITVDEEIYQALDDFWEDYGAVMKKYGIHSRAAFVTKALFREIGKVMQDMERIETAPKIFNQPPEEWKRYE